MMTIFFEWVQSFWYLIASKLKSKPAATTPAPVTVQTDSHPSTIPVTVDVTVDTDSTPAPEPITSSAAMAFKPAINAESTVGQGASNLNMVTSGEVVVSNPEVADGNSQSK